MSETRSETEFEAALASALAGGPERHHQKTAQQGKLPVRERVERLVDPESFSEEGLLANWDADGLEFMPIAPWSGWNGWLTCVVFDDLHQSSDYSLRELGRPRSTTGQQLAETIAYHPQPSFNVGLVLMLAATATVLGSWQLLWLQVLWLQLLWLR